MVFRARLVFASSIVALPLVLACTSDKGSAVAPQEDAGGCGVSQAGAVLCQDSAVDSTLPDANEPDTNVVDSAVADTNVPDTNAPDTSDANEPDATKLVDADVDGETTDGSDARAPDAGTDAGGVSAACTACMATNCSGPFAGESCGAPSCADTYPTCSGDPDCTPILTCWADSLGSASPPDESATCPTGHTTGISQAFLLGDCAARGCAASCPWAQALPGCWECLFGEVPTDSNACWVNQSCVSWVDCVILCGASDLSCFQACGSPDAPAGVLENDMSNGSCAASCPIL